MRLPAEHFIHCLHINFINASHVADFERKKTSLCLFDWNLILGSTPVSRSRMSEVRDVFGLI